MTLEEIKAKVYSLIEEYSEDADELTEDEDLALKMNHVINQIQNELARFKKIEAYTTLDGLKGDLIDFSSVDNNLYQLNIVRGLDCEIIGQKIKFNENGTAEVYYYKYPTQINADTSDSQELDLSIDVLEIMPYGVAADLLKSDVSSNYGRIYAERYREMKSELDPRYAMGAVYIDTSNAVDI
ncbi:MAG: hypothetical protein IJ272_08155 [Clostridia bacterium]|nr:hypothetical protein [Clostridia bacterium]